MTAFDKARTAYIQAIISDNSTVRELAEAATVSPDFAGHITLGDIARVANTQSAPRHKVVKEFVTTVTASAQPELKRRNVRCNMRRQAGRDKFDAYVLAVLVAGGGKLATANIALRLADVNVDGGTPLQRRASLDRLIAQGYVARSGKARAMRYWATAAGKRAAK